MLLLLPIIYPENSIPRAFGKIDRSIQRLLAKSSPSFALGLCFYILEESKELICFARLWSHTTPRQMGAVFCCVLLSCSRTLTVGICYFPRFWALYLTPPTTIFKATAVSSVAMSVSENFHNHYIYANVSCRGQTFKASLRVVRRRCSRERTGQWVTNPSGTLPSRILTGLLTLCHAKELIIL